MKINHFIDPIEFGDKIIDLFYSTNKFYLNLQQSRSSIKKRKTTLLKFL